MNGAELGRLEHQSSTAITSSGEVFAAVLPRRVKGRTNKQWRAEKSGIIKLHPLERLEKGIVHPEVCMSNELTLVHVQLKADCCTCLDNFSYLLYLISYHPRLLYHYINYQEDFGASTSVKHNQNIKRLLLLLLLLLLLYICTHSCLCVWW